MKNNNNGAAATEVVALATENTNGQSTNSQAKAETHETAAVVLATRNSASRIEANKQFANLIGKFEAARLRTEGIREFKQQDDGSGLKLTLVNSNRQHVEVTNQQMINRCIDLLIETGQHISDSLEREVVAFEV